MHVWRPTFRDTLSTTMADGATDSGFPDHVDNEMEDGQSRRSSSERGRSVVPSQLATIAIATMPQAPPPPQLLVVQILTMVLENGTALVLQRPRPHSIHHLNALRAPLILLSPFFDPLHRTHELRARTRPARISFPDLIVLLARLVRVLAKLGREDAPDERMERVWVRNTCLDLPFFDPRNLRSARPFEHSSDFMDEGCFL